MTDKRNKNESSILNSRYLASEEEHQQFARETEGELVISLGSSRPKKTKSDRSEG